MMALCLVRSIQAGFLPAKKQAELIRIKRQRYNLCRTRGITFAERGISISLGVEDALGYNLTTYTIRRHLPPFARGSKKGVLQILRNSIEKDGITWTNLLDVKGNKAVTELYNTSFLPTNVLIDRNGMVVARNIDLSELEKQVTRLLE